MSGFDPTWLSLREPADARSRSSELARLLADWLVSRSPAGEHRIVDLGCGTGANLRFLTPLLRTPRRWTCIDDDARVLALVGPLAEPLRLDLSAHLERAFEPPPAVVTASALLDLVSREWLSRFVVAASLARAAVLIALSYDGRMSFTPPHEEDARVLASFNAHQRRDKGFGPALGPDAASCVPQAFADAGFDVRSAPSYWCLDAAAAQDAALLTPLVAGIATAACEQDQQAAVAVKRWLRARERDIAGGVLHALIGHQDLLALPPATAWRTMD